MAMCWDVTVICPLADSYVSGAAHEALATAEVAATRKEAKYAGITGRYLFDPIAVETLGPLNSSARLSSGLRLTVQTLLTKTPGHQIAQIHLTIMFWY